MTNQNQPDSPLIDQSELSTESIESANNGTDQGQALCYWQNVGYNGGDTLCIQGRVFVCEFNGWVHYGTMC